MSGLIAIFRMPGKTPKRSAKIAKQKTTESRSSAATADAEASFRVTKYVKVAFFRGASLRPIPPGKSKQEEVRYLDIHEDDELDEAELAAWVKQASELPGERM